MGREMHQNDSKAHLYGLEIPRWISELALRITAYMTKMRRVFVAADVRPKRRPAFYTLKKKRIPVALRCGVSNCQGLFNCDDVTKNLHCVALAITVLLTPVALFR